MSELMRVYYLDTPLSQSELQGLEELTEWEVEQVRVPLLLPEGKGWKEDQVVPEAPLRRAGILKDYGKRCALVQLSSETLYWNTLFTEAIARLTGRWPYLVQTKASREAMTIALANVGLPDGSPYKFTRKDVELLKVAAGAVRCDNYHFGVPWDEQEILAQRYESMADRIEALLPPEK